MHAVSLQPKCSKTLSSDIVAMKRWYNILQMTIQQYYVKFQNFTMDKMAAILADHISKCIFFYMKNFEFLLKFHWSLFLRIQLIIIQHWFR